MGKKADTSDILIFFIIAAVLGVMVLLIYSQTMAARAAYGSLTAEQAALSRDRDRLDRLVGLKNRAGEMKERVARFDHMMPREPEEHALLNDIKAVADSCGVHLVQIRLEERVNGQGYVEMPFKATFEGRYNNLVNLLQEIKKGPRAVRIDEVKMGKGQRELPYIRAEITSSAFFASGHGTPGSDKPGT